MTPADWIMVANLFHTVESDLSKGSLPTALRRVMKEKFTSFDEYQLAKYNKSIKVNKPMDMALTKTLSLYFLSLWKSQLLSFL